MLWQSRVSGDSSDSDNGGSGMPESSDDDSAYTSGSSTDAEDGRLFPRRRKAAILHASAKWNAIAARTPAEERAARSARHEKQSAAREAKRQARRGGAGPSGMSFTIAILCVRMVGPIAVVRCPWLNGSGGSVMFRLRLYSAGV